jgi:hypothetical protein
MTMALMNETMHAQKSDRRVLFQRVTSAGALLSRQFLTFQATASLTNEPQPMKKSHQTIKRLTQGAFGYWA